MMEKLVLTNEIKLIKGGICMSGNNQKFVMTKDKATAQSFIASGFKLVSQIGSRVQMVSYLRNFDLLRIAFLMKKGYLL